VNLPGPLAAQADIGLEKRELAEQLQSGDATTAVSGRAP
jgi:hypothetical protein